MQGPLLPSVLSPPLFLLFSALSLSLPLEIGPLNAARRVWGSTVSSSTESGAEPQQKSN